MDALPGCNPVSNTVAEIPTSCALAVPDAFTPTVYEGAAAPPGANVVAGTPTVLESYGEWTYVDCYSDAASTRALVNGLTTANKTIEGCLDAAQAQGYSHAGIEYYGECWAANSLESSSTAIGYAKCGQQCTDDPLHYCGGPNAIDLYVVGKANTTTSSSTSPTKTNVALASSVSSTTATTSGHAASVSTVTKTVYSTVYAACSATASHRLSRRSRHGRQV